MFDLITGVDGTTLKAEIIDDLWWLHLDYKGGWGLSKYKKMLSQFLEALEYLNTIGVSSVYVSIDKNDEKLEKFERMFGLTPLIVNGNYLVLWRDT